MATYKVPVTIQHPGAGGTAYNIFNLRCQDEADLGDALGALHDFYEALTGCYPDGTTILVGDGIIKDPYGAPTYVGFTPDPLEATGLAAQSPQLLAIVVSWRTTSATRSGRGRTFLGPLTPAVFDSDGTIASVYLGGIQSAAEDLVSASTGLGGWAYGVYSHKDSVIRDWTASSVKDRASYLSSRRD